MSVTPRPEVPAPFASNASTDGPAMQGVPTGDENVAFGTRRNGWRVVLTGGPGAGKTTVADLFRRELGEEVVVVPEAATLLFSGGFPRYEDPAAVCAAQQAIFSVQRGLEDTQSAHFPGRILLCDRGTVDGAVFWPSSNPSDFFAAVGTTEEEEFARYDAVIFFETAAVGGISIEGGNPTRTESVEQAVIVDRQLRQLWSRHPRFMFIPHNPSFFKKVASGLVAIESVVAQLQHAELGTG